MALDNVLKIYDEQGNPVDYDILASDVKFNDGKDLPTKLDELEQEIGEGGYTPPQGGIPKTDLSSDVQTSLGKADTAYQKPASGIPATDLADGVIPDTANLATKTELQQGLADKVDKVTGYGLSKNDYTDADKTAVGTIGSKANAADVYTKAQTNAAIQDAVEDLGGGSVDSVTINGTKHTPDANGDVDLGTIVGQKGDKGDTGNVEFEDLADLVALLVNDLTTGGAGNFLSAEMGKRLKQNVDAVQANILKLYNKLANMAFWDAADQAAAQPTPIDWSVPKITVTLDKTNVTANAMITDESDQEITGTSVSVDEGSGLTLKIKPRANYAITNASATIGGVLQTLTEGNGVYTLEIASVTSAITIVLSVSATAAIPITYSTPTHCSVPSGVTNPTEILSGGTANIKYECESGYALTPNNITISGASIGTITNVGDVYTIPITHDGTSQSISIAVTAREVLPYEVPAGGEMVFFLDGRDLTDGATTWVDKIGNVQFSGSGTVVKNGNTPVGISFDGNSQGFSHASDLKFSPVDYTIEIVAIPANFNQHNYNYPFVNGTADANSGGRIDSIYAILFKNGNTAYMNGVYVNGSGTVNQDGSWSGGNVWGMSYNAGDKVLIGANKNCAVKNGTSCTSTGAVHWNTIGGGAHLGYSSVVIGNPLRSQTTVFAVRIYRGQLTAAQMLHNQKIDNERYGLGLTLPDSVS